MTERIGILDWGIGAVGILRSLNERSRSNILYLSDTGVTPYGKMRRPELVSRLDRVLGFFAEKNISKVLIGCNAASTAIPFLQQRSADIIGMIEPAADLAARQEPERLGLIGGRRTVLSGAYRKAFRERGITVEQRIAQPLSGMIESGMSSSETFLRESRRIMSPVKHCSHILLACTHYPAAADILERFVSERTILIDPASAVVDEVLKWDVGESDGQIEFLTTGDPKKMRMAAKQAFDLEIDDPRNINL